MTDTDDFSSLKRNAKTSLQSYNEEAKKLTTTYASDDRYWSLQVDKAGNGRAVIRFLPQPKGEPAPFVKYFSHGFEVGAKNWYIENCPTTLDGAPCPVCESNSKLWKEAGDNKNHPNIATVRNRKRKLHYVSNILVIQDDAKPENNGKVFLFRYGKKIFEMINLAMNPLYKGDVAINPFDFWEGANFTMKQRKVDDYPNFDLSKFETTTPISEDDDEIKKIWLQQHPLQAIVDPKNFKSYEVLKSRLDKVLGNTPEPKNSVKAQEKELDGVPWEKDPVPAAKVAATKKVTNPDDFFAELMNDE